MTSIRYIDLVIAIKVTWFYFLLCRGNYDISSSSIAESRNTNIIDKQMKKRHAIYGADRDIKDILYWKQDHAKLLMENWVA